VQTASGFNVAEGEAYAAFKRASASEPRALPMQALDHAAGYLLAFGINAAQQSRKEAPGKYVCPLRP